MEETALEAADREQVMAQACESPRSFYDRRYRNGYQAEVLDSGYDACVLAALRWGLGRSGLRDGADAAVLDLGCGQGRYLPVLAAELPAAELHGSDISAVALELAADRFPAASYLAADGHRVPAGDERFDLIVMVDVIEHVADAEQAAAELARLLRPGGKVVLTTPCANRGSAAWVFNRVTDGFEPTPDGIGRFRTDEPAHLRRLRSDEAAALLRAAGLDVSHTRWWGHVATPLSDRFQRIPVAVRRRLAMLDWRLMRRLPNGGAMVVVAAKPGRPPASAATLGGTA